MANETTKSSASDSSTFINVGILGATGTVGQKFILLLANHPFFRISVLGASDRSLNKEYSQAVEWKQKQAIPECVKTFKIVKCEVNEFVSKCKVIFSALDSSIAGSIEEEFAKIGFAVFSNAKNHRMDDDIPILIPEVNPEHLQLVNHQQKKRDWKGFIVTNANCSSTGLVIALKPLMDRFGIEQVIVFTMQAISGSGYPGISAMDMCDNIYPYISGEEEKMEIEPKKILGLLNSSKDGIHFNEMKLSAHCNRVPVLDGHTECISVKLKTKATVEEVKQALSNYSPGNVKNLMPSAPKFTIVVREELDRPQPRLDREEGDGFTVVVGKVRKCNIFDIKFTLLSHNTIIGAAGGSILNAELAKSQGYIT